MVSAIPTGDIWGRQRLWNVFRWWCFRWGKEEIKSKGEEIKVSSKECCLALHEIGIGTAVQTRC